MSTHNDPEYEVGYGKPPASRQFKKGRSGNPKGRPKGAKGVQASLKRELQTKISVQEGGRTMRITKAEAMAKQFMASALKGDMKAILALVKLDPELFGSAVLQLETEAEQSEQAPEQVDYDILREFLSGSAPDEDDGTIEDWEIDDWQIDDGEHDHDDM